MDFPTSTLFGAPVYNTYGRRLALEAADSPRVPMPIARLVHDRLLALLAHGGEKLDWSALAGLSAKDSGLGANP